MEALNQYQYSEFLKDTITRAAIGLEIQERFPKSARNLATITAEHSRHVNTAAARHIWQAAAGENLTQALQAVKQMALDELHTLPPMYHKMRGY